MGLRDGASAVGKVFRISRRSTEKILRRPGGETAKKLALWVGLTESRPHADPNPQLPFVCNLLVQLARGDRIITESDAMASMSSSIAVQTRWNGGFFRAILRALFGGETLFVNEFSLDSQGELVLTQPMPGDIEVIDLKGQTLYLQPGAFLACDPTVEFGARLCGSPQSHRARGTVPAQGQRPWPCLVRCLQWHRREGCAGRVHRR